MSTAKTKGLIVGAGLSGITLALLLERAGVKYDVFERATVIEPLGSAVSLGSNVLNMFKQLNLLDEIQRIGKPFPFTDICDENRVVQNRVVQNRVEVSFDADEVVNGTADNKKHLVRHRDILIVADGTYSDMWQNMYKQLKFRGKLFSGNGELPFSLCTLSAGQLGSI
ncbi:hypothetical protein BG000_004809 [Podila horticola]|nr:hypothetical protein BG000_004809 [Podila horticola]